MFNLPAFIEQMLGCSKTEAKRLITQGAIKINNIQTKSFYLEEIPLYIQIGKGRFYQIEGMIAYQLNKKPETH